MFVNQAEEYSSYYIYSAKTCNSLRIGSAIIEEILAGRDKMPDAQRRRREEEEQKELVEKVKASSQQRLACSILNLRLAAPQADLGRP